MREKERIVRIIELIGQLWDIFPDHRLGQLLANFVFGHHTDIFFQEDDNTEKILIKTIKFYNKEEKKRAKAHVKKL
jgi:hypothetical protein